MQRGQEKVNVELADALLSLSLLGGWMFPAARRQEVVGVHGLGVSSFFLLFLRAGRVLQDWLCYWRQEAVFPSAAWLDEIGNLGSCCNSSSKKLVWWLAFEGETELFCPPLRQRNLVLVALNLRCQDRLVWLFLVIISVADIALCHIWMYGV